MSNEIRTIQAHRAATTTFPTQAINPMSFYDPTVLTGISTLAKGIVASKLFGNISYEQCFVILQTGMELGIAPTAAMSGIHVIQGRASMSGQLMVSLVNRAGHKFEIVEESDERAITRITRHDTGASRTVTYTIKDAQAAGLVGKDNWNKYKSVMLLNRSISKNVRYSCPEVLGGIIYTPEDFGAVVHAGSQAQVVIPTQIPSDAVSISAVIQAQAEPEAPQVDEEWESLVRQMTDYMKQGGAPTEKIEQKVAEWTGYITDPKNGREKAVKGISKYIGNLRDALARKAVRHHDYDPIAAMAEALKGQGLEGEPAANYAKARYEEWLEECGGDTEAAKLKVYEWIKAASEPAQ